MSLTQNRVVEGRGNGEEVRLNVTKSEPMQHKTETCNHMNSSHHDESLLRSYQRFMSGLAT